VLTISAPNDAPPEPPKPKKPQSSGEQADPTDDDGGFWDFSLEDESPPPSKPKRNREAGPPRKKRRPKQEPLFEDDFSSSTQDDFGDDDLESGSALPPRPRKKKKRKRRRPEPERQTQFPGAISVMGMPLSIIIALCAIGLTMLVRGADILLYILAGSGNNPGIAGTCCFFDSLVAIGILMRIDAFRTGGVALSLLEFFFTCTCGIAFITDMVPFAGANSADVRIVGVIMLGLSVLPATTAWCLMVPSAVEYCDN